MSIVQVCADRGIAPGSTKGAAQHLRGIAAGFAAAGHQVVTHAARRAQGSFPVEVRPLDELRDHGPASTDLVYERYSLGHRNGLALARATGAPFVLEVNAPLVAEAEAHRPDTVGRHDRTTEADLLREADLVITVSTALTAWVESQRVGPTVTITNGFEAAWFDATISIPDAAASSTPTIAFIGHPKPWHGADRLPSMLRRLAELGHRPRVSIIGGGPGADRVMALADDLGVADQIATTGALPPEQASALLALATIGIAPYHRQEPFYFCPLKVIDYLAAGLAIVSTRQGDIPDLVADAGIVVDPDSDDDLATAVADLLDDPDRTAGFAAAGRRRAAASMTWNHVAARTLAAVDALRTPAPVR